jgi:HAD superfamily hydrolase (TIGR01549 family)
MSLDLDRIKALCFDVDGTLNDTDDQFAEKVKAFLNPMGVLPFVSRDKAARWFVMWAEAPTNALLGYADRIGIDDKLASLMEWLYKHHRRKKKTFQLISGVAELLNSLDGHYPMAIVTARDEYTSRQFLEQFDLSRCFTCIATAQTCRHTKPYPDPLLWAAKQMGVQPGACLMIGDTTVDIRAGRSAGAQTMGVLCGFGGERELRRMGADEIIMSTAELGKALKV